MTIESGALKIIKSLKDAGYAAYYAGGWVRDFLLDHPSDDIDIATEAKPEKIVELFQKTIEVGISFGVVVVLMDGHQYEVATFREDLGYEDGRRPTQCAYTNAEGDAKRRDFTINGMFYDPLEKNVIDFVDGRKDLEKGVIRAIGDPYERFKEDRLRMIRAIRFTYRFGYALDPDTEQAIKDHAHCLFPAVAMERVWHELQKMARYPSFGEALLKMHAVGLLAEVFPPLKKVPEMELLKRVEAINRFPLECPAVLQVMELFPNSPLEEQVAFCYYLKVSNKEIKLVEYTHQVRTQVSDQDADWVPLYAHPQAETVLQVVCARKNGGQFQVHRERMDRLRVHINRIVNQSPVVSASMLLEEGIVPGRQMGELLREAERLAISHDLHLPEEVLLLLKKQTVWSKE
ncbi:CCA-adding enzyme [Waddlia chondrophila 2032/99]|uniref:CCA-adding enzyme n=1 Tax=Waddlia chondrophila 2032/99 TaxID=765953 RepID=F8LB02_9BACT|nr:CCA-adding enzyme [Waddlia chondrophila 2032/99]